jgi:hypothetical protein
MTLRGAFLLGCLLLEGCAGRREQRRSQPVRMMVGRSIAFLPVLFAERLGLYDKEGLAVSIDTTAVSTTQPFRPYSGTAPTSRAASMSRHSPQRFKANHHILRRFTARRFPGAGYFP